MTHAFSILMGLAMLATLAVLTMGIFSMARGGAFAKKYGNKFMWARVYLQGAALVFFALALMSRTGGE